MGSRCTWMLTAIGALLLGVSAARAQESPLSRTETEPAPAKKADSDKRSVITGDRVVSDGAAKAGQTVGSQGSQSSQGSQGTPGSPRVGDVVGSRLRVDVNLVLVPLTVTDPLNRLVTGLEKDNFFLYDQGVLQTIKTFSTEDAPLTIGIVFDLSGSMNSKFIRARKALTEFLRTCNPQDEFFVVGFNDRPAVLVDYTSDADDVEARMVMLRPENRTALLDAIYLGVDHLKDAKYARKALLVISDGGDNRSRYTEGQVQRAVRESDVQIYSIGIFDKYAASDEEQRGPLLLNDLSEGTGGRLFIVQDVADLTDIAERISNELRNEYVLGFSPSDRKRDGTWRKVKVRLVPPPGLPELTVHAREGYYAPSQ